MENKGKEWGDHFQTPQHICEYMASFLPEYAGLILEPTPGKGNLVKVLEKHGIVQYPLPGVDFFELEKSPLHNRYNWIVMNPPFTPMKMGYEILYSCMNMTNNIVALMPYLTIINGEKRTKDIMDWGLRSITHLPRSTFKGSRVQTCILHMEKGFKGDTIFKVI